MAKGKSVSVKVTGFLSGSSKVSRNVPSLPRLDTVDSRFKFLKTSWGLWDKKVKRQPQTNFTCTEPEDSTVCLWRHGSIFNLNKPNANCSPINIRRHLWEGLGEQKTSSKATSPPGRRMRHERWVKVLFSNEKKKFNLEKPLEMFSTRSRHRDLWCFFLQWKKRSFRLCRGI